MVVLIGFSTSTNPISRIIRFFTGSKASHCWILIQDAFAGQDMIMEATEGGFRLVPYVGYNVGHVIVDIVTPVIPLDEGVEKAVSWLGGRYDYTGLIGALFVLLGRRLKKRWKNPLQSSSAMFCSEAVVFLLQEAKYPGADLLDPSGTTPQDLINFLRPRSH